jgi:hypothetical protein
MSFADNPTIGAMADGNSSLSGSIIVFALIFVLWLKLECAPEKGEIRRAAASAYLCSRVTDIADWPHDWAG